MILEFSVLSKTKVPETLCERYILFFVNNISCLNCIQTDGCGICTSGVNIKKNDILARALRKHSEGDIKGDPSGNGLVHFLRHSLLHYKEWHYLHTDKHQFILLNHCLFICLKNSKTATTSATRAYPITHKRWGNTSEKLPEITARSTSTA